MSGITKEDLRDVDIVDAVELASSGSAADEYLSDSVTSVVSGVVTVSSKDLRNPDWAPEQNDLFVLSGATAGNGTYTVNQVTGQYTFTVNEAIPDSTGGSASFRHPAGAGRVGVDSSGMIYSDGSELQQVLEDFDDAIDAGGGGGITPGTHEDLDTLTHWLAEDYLMSRVVESGKTTAVYYSERSGTAITAFADAGGGQVTVTSAGHGLVLNSEIYISGTTNYDGYYVVANPLTNTFEITATWAGDDGTGSWRKKIRATEITRDAGKVSQIDEIQYDDDGVEDARMVEVITRAAGKVDTIDGSKTGGP